MRTRSLSGLTIATVMALLLLPGAVSAQTSTLLVADNPGADCVAPVPATVVVGDLGTALDVQDAAEIDKVTMAADYGADMVDAAFHDDGHQASVETTADVNGYIVWSCAPMNGEPIQRNDGSDV